MRIIHLDEVTGKHITQYDSSFIMRKLLMTDQPSHVGVMDLGENGIVGYHEATVPQMLIILEGEGWVRAGEKAKVKVTAGDVVLWDKWEGHETTTDSGLKAIVIESEGMDISTF